MRRARGGSRLYRLSFHVLNLILDQVIFGAIALLFVASGSIRIEASSDRVTVVDPLQQHEVPAADIQRVDIRNGLRFVKADWHSVNAWSTVRASCYGWAHCS